MSEKQEEMVTIVVKAPNSSQDSHRPASSDSPPSPDASSTASVEVPRKWLTTPLLQVLELTGGACEETGLEIRGIYKECGSHHKHRLYIKKDEESWGSVYISYWDDRRGRKYCGWYITDEVDFHSHVYAFNPSRSFDVPRTGWQPSLTEPADNSLIIEQTRKREQGKECNSSVEAKLHRWQDETSPPDYVLELPEEGCHAGEGARLFKLRLESWFGEAAAARPKWEPLDWLRASSTPGTALATMFHIFDMTLMEGFAEEVARALASFKLPCSSCVANAAGQYGVVLKRIIPVHEHITLPVRELKKTVENAATAHDIFPVDDDSSMESIDSPSEVSDVDSCFFSRTEVLANRAIAGTDPSKELVEILIDAFFKCFRLDQKTLPTLQSVAGGFGEVKQVMAFGSLLDVWDPKHDWLIGRLLSIIHRRIDAFVDMVEAVGVNILAKRKLVPPERGQIRWEAPFKCIMAKFVSKAQSVLFVQSTLQPEKTDAIVNAIRLGDALMRTWLQTTLDIRPFFRVDPLMFAAASLAVQTAFLDVMPDAAYSSFRDSVHLVHEGVRHKFVAHSRDLSHRDRQFLAKAFFPASKRDTPETGVEGPHAKFART